MVVDGNIYYGDFEDDVTDDGDGEGVSAHMLLWHAICTQVGIPEMSSRAAGYFMDGDWYWSSMFNHSGFSDIMLAHYKSPGPCSGAADPGYLRLQYKRFVKKERHIEDLEVQSRVQARWNNPRNRKYLDAATASRPTGMSNSNGADNWSEFDGKWPSSLEEFHDILNDACDQGRVVAAYFYAPWCGISIGRSAKTYSECSSNPCFADVEFVKIDCEENEETAIHYGIASIPTLKIIRDVKVVDETIGPDCGRVAAMLARHM